MGQVTKENMKLIHEIFRKFLFIHPSNCTFISVDYGLEEKKDSVFYSTDNIGLRGNSYISRNAQHLQVKVLEGIGEGAVPKGPYKVYVEEKEVGEFYLNVYTANDSLYIRVQAFSSWGLAVKISLYYTGESLITKDRFIVKSCMVLDNLMDDIDKRVPHLRRAIPSVVVLSAFFAFMNPVTSLLIQLPLVIGLNLLIMRAIIYFNTTINFGGFLKHVESRLAKKASELSRDTAESNQIRKLIDKEDSRKDALERISKQKSKERAILAELREDLWLLKNLGVYDRAKFEKEVYKDLPHLDSLNEKIDFYVAFHLD